MKLKWRARFRATWGRGLRGSGWRGRAASPTTEPYSSSRAPPPHFLLHERPPPIPGFSEQPRDSFALTVFAETLFLCYSAKSMAILRSQGKLYLKTAFPGKASHQENLERIQISRH